MKSKEPKTEKPDGQGSVREGDSPAPEGARTSRRLFHQEMRAKNDAEFVATEGDRTRVMLDIAASVPLPSIAARLRPPYGISIGKLKEVFWFEIKHGRDQVLQTLMAEKLIVARGGMGAKLHARLAANSELQDRLGKRGDGKKDRASPQTVIEIRPSLGNNAPAEDDDEN